MLFRKFLKASPFVVLTLLNLLALNARAADGGISGGGGDTQTEARIDEIRADILKWISNGGAEKLKFPEGLTAAEYRDAMIPLLAPHAVVIGAITDAEEARTSDPDLKVSVDGQPKTCRGSIWQKDGLPHILCKVERFKASSPNEQYRLIHHEYAGLKGLEKNAGASSDYVLSNQISRLVGPETVWRLGVREVDTRTEPELFNAYLYGYYQLVHEVSPGSNGCPKTALLDTNYAFSGLRISEVIGDNSTKVIAVGNHRVNELVTLYPRPDNVRGGPCTGYIGEITENYSETGTDSNTKVNFKVNTVSNAGCNAFSRKLFPNELLRSDTATVILNRKTGILMLTVTTEEPGKGPQNMVCTMQHISLQRPEMFLVRANPAEDVLPELK